MLVRALKPLSVFPMAAPAAANSGRPRSFRLRGAAGFECHEEQAIALCEGVIDVSAALSGVSSKEMRLTGWTRMAVARVRQIAMYVTHVALGLPMAEVGKGFRRDRTTVLHACHLVEDLRDDRDFDAIVATLERVSLAAFGSREAA